MTQANTPAGDSTSITLPPSPPAQTLSAAAQEIDAAFPAARADNFILPREAFTEGMSAPRMMEQAAQFRG